ncbi:MAG TPA: hypothetical protein VIH26_11300 [Anaerolineales bacterium]
MNKKRLIDWPYVIGLLLLPIAVVLVLHGVRAVQEATRYDEAYFTDEYLRRYETPGSVAIDLEQALRHGDSQLMAGLVGTRGGPAPIEPRPSLIYVFLLSVDGDYFQYLYFNADDYNRVVQYVTKVGGRYVASEPDLYFYMDSGRWLGVAGPIATTWWILVTVFTAGVLVYRRMAVSRQEMYEQQSGERQAGAGRK